ncbi:MAG: damage-inducible protein CinA [Chryseobacterium sp.]|jgi:hypothetical protein|nr:damage-inducible protein CinA [Chryseobacterium sp.]
MEFQHSLLDYISRSLKSTHETVSVAESVTSGYLQFSFSQMKDASEFFKGGITAYTLEEKVNLLNVNKEEAEKCDVKKDFPKLNRYTRKTMELERLRTISAAAQTIKYADISDNCKEIPLHDPSFAVRYLKECYEILKALDKGNPTLRRKAINLVLSELEVAHNNS